MSELIGPVTWGMDHPPPPGLPRGEVWITRKDNGDVYIDHADPRVLISSELLNHIRAGECHPWAWLDEPHPGALLERGSVLHFAAVNRHLIYRITGYYVPVHAFIGEWPD